MAEIADAVSAADQHNHQQRCFGGQGGEPVYVIATSCTFQPEGIEDALRAYDERLIPLYGALPGFLSFMAVRTGSNSVLAIVVWESEEAARSGERLVLPKARNLHGSILTEMTRYAGRVSMAKTPALPNTLLVQEKEVCHADAVDREDADREGERDR